MTPYEIHMTEPRIKILVNQHIKNGRNQRSVMQFIREGLNERAAV